MTVESRFLIYPDGDSQETDTPLRIDQLVDMNGSPLRLPLPTARMVAYRVMKIRVTEDRGEEITRYYLELVRGTELRSLASE